MKNINVVFTDIGGDVINRVLGEKWLHVLVELEPGLFYEATWPRVKKGPTYRARKELKLPYRMTDKAHARMVEFAESKLGLRYSFFGYFFPQFYNKTKGIYCSQFACMVLREGGFPIPIGVGYSPDKLLKALRVYDIPNQEPPVNWNGWYGDD
jgi:hypothetical protein